MGHTSPKSSKRRYIPCMGSRWKGEGGRETIRGSGVLGPPVEPAQTLFLSFVFLFFFSCFFISDRIATSNFLFSILDQGNPWKWTSLLELVLKGHHAGEWCLLSLTLYSRVYSEVLLFQARCNSPDQEPLQSGTWA